MDGGAPSGPEVDAELCGVGIIQNVSWRDLTAPDSVGMFLAKRVAESKFSFGGICYPFYRHEHDPRAILLS
jgi:hypothetical protein